MLSQSRRCNSFLELLALVLELSLALAEPTSEAFGGGFSVTVGMVTGVPAGVAVGRGS